jgi:hypothetical protein
LGTAAPEIGPTTHFLDHEALIAGFAESGWYKANIPFIDIPDKQIQEVYYYRWRTAHEAQKYTGAKNGWIITEFLGPISYSAPYGGISAAAGHHIAEARWIRDTRYADDYINYWLVGDGSGPKSAEDSVNKNTDQCTVCASSAKIESGSGSLSLGSEHEFLQTRDAR